MKDESSKDSLTRQEVQKMIENAVYHAYIEGIKDATYQINEALKKAGYHI
ncbi:MAG: hypothetical protein IJS14_05575 [Lentisphaeria bacterium]|nr:hypothetical protein [Lentisphaeria bacterium]